MNLAGCRNGSKDSRHRPSSRTKGSAYRAAKRDCLARTSAEPSRRLYDFDRELDVTVLIGSGAVLDADKGGEGSDLTFVGCEFSAALVVNWAALRSITKCVPHEDPARFRCRLRR